MRRRILFVITSVARGGAERQVVDLSVELTRRGWDVTVMSMIPPTDYQDELVDGGVALTTLGMTQGRATVSALVAYARYVRRWRPNLVHAHMVHANLLARVGRVLVPSVPVISTIHNVVEGPRWREVAYRLTDFLSSATTAVSHAAADRYVAVGAVPAGRVAVIHNGIDVAGKAAAPRSAVRAELGLEEDSFAWLTVGRLMPAKGHDLLIDAFAQLAHEFSEAHLLIAGGGPGEPALRQRVDALGLRSRVSLLGERRDVPRLLATADAFVLSSRWEGLPMVLLEAAAHRLPIVSTDVGGCREIARPDRGAILTQPSADALAASMAALMRWSPAQRAQSAEALFEHVAESFSLSTVVDRWEELYAEVAPPQR